MFQPAHVPGGITTTSLAFGLIAPDDAPIIATSSLHPLSPCWTPALLSLFNLCGHLRVFRHPFSLDDRPDLASKWPSTSESNMYDFCFHKPRAQVNGNVSSRAHLLWFISMLVVDGWWWCWVGGVVLVVGGHRLALPRGGRPQ